MSTDDSVAGERGWKRLGCLIPIGSALLLLVVVPYGFIAFLFWAADGSWNFEGERNWRYWLFVKGSRLERLGLVSRTDGPAKYSVSLQEGNSPGWSVTIYRSTATPEAVTAHYAERCRDLNLKIIEGPQPHTANLQPGEIASVLTCEIERYLDVEVHAARKQDETSTEVSVRVWGDR